MEYLIDTFSFGTFVNSRGEMRDVMSYITASNSIPRDQGLEFHNLDHNGVVWSLAGQRGPIFYFQEWDGLNSIFVTTEGRSFHADPSRLGWDIACVIKGLLAENRRTLLVLTPVNNNEYPVGFAICRVYVVRANLIWAVLNKNRTTAVPIGEWIAETDTDVGKSPPLKGRRRLRIV